MMLNFAGFSVIAYCTYKSGVTNYFEMIGYYLNNIVKKIVEIYIIIVVWGVCIVYCVLLQNQIFTSAI